MFPAGNLEWPLFKIDFRPKLLLTSLKNPTFGGSSTFGPTNSLQKLNSNYSLENNFIFTCY